MDGISFAQIDASGAQEWLAGLRKELVAKRYRPQAVRQVMIPKPGGGEGPLGIPTVTANYPSPQRVFGMG
jgi:RNA-directed DNA polymerase